MDHDHNANGSERSPSESEFGSSGHAIVVDDMCVDERMMQEEDQTKGLRLAEPGSRSSDYSSEMQPFALSQLHLDFTAGICYHGRSFGFQGALKVLANSLESLHKTPKASKRS